MISLNKNIMIFTINIFWNIKFIIDNSKKAKSCNQISFYKIFLLVIAYKSGV